MIPKIIHYCWFGRGEMPKLMKKCLKSWKKHCPDWQIIEWNEDNFDISSTLWTKQAYEAKKYAFVSDYVRLWALHKMGGVYLDTDLELRKPLDVFLSHDAFLGFENKISVATCLIGAAAGNRVVHTWLDWYTDRPYLKDGKPNTEPNVIFITEDMIRRGLVINNQQQSVEGIEVYPQSWFCPQNMDGENRARNRNTVSIHHFTSTWRSDRERKNMKRAKWHSTKTYKALIWLRYLPNRIIRKVLGDKFIDNIKKNWAVKRPAGKER